MKVKQTVYLHKRSYGDAYGDDHAVFSYDMSDMDGYILLATQEVEFDVTVDIRAAQVESLDKKITKTRAEFERQLMALTEQRNNLLALGVEG